MSADAKQQRPPYPKKLSFPLYIGKNSFCNMAGIFSLLNLQKVGFTLDSSASVRVLQDLANQHLHVQRLAHVAVHARVQAGLHVVGKDIGRHGDDGRALAGPLALKRPDAPGSLQAVHLGHHDVHQNRVIGARRSVLDGLQRQSAVLNGGDAGTLLLQQGCGDLAVQLVILGQQQVQTGPWILSVDKGRL